MAAMLRLGSKDRTSFLFKKQRTDDTSAISDSTLLGGPLPTIAHVDTRSFIGLFDRYQSTESSQAAAGDHFSHASPSAKDFAWPAASPLHYSLAMLNSQSNTRAIQSTRVSSNADSAGFVARNDSTGSSSVAMSKRSDDSPPMTRNSSSSSIMQPPTPVAPKTIRLETEFTTLPNFEESSHSPFKLKGRASTWGHSTSAITPQLDLDKPLPPLQRTRSRNKSQSDLPPPKSILKTTMPSKNPSMRKHNRATSAPLLVTFTSEGYIPGLPPPTPPTSRGARLGRAMAYPSLRQRSKSATLVDGVDFSSSTMKRKPVQQAQPLSDNQAPTPKAQRQSKRQSLKPISSRTAEQVIYRIMCHLDDIKDLRAAALVSKGFLNTYQRNESKLVSHLIFKTSRPAWELRRCILTLRGSTTFRLNEYMRDVRTVKALKGIILGHCNASIKPKTLAGLTAQDPLCEVEVENALWRIWSFCALFGDNAAQSPIPPVEVDWLNGSNGLNSKTMGAGFGAGNGPGLNPDELEDVMEMWTCLQSVLSQFHGREDEAKRVGIFDNWQAASGVTKQQQLVEWTSYLLTLGPQVVLSLSSGSFDRAKMFGLTHWTLPPFGQTRSLFLTSAISHVYQERILAEATAKAAQITLPRMSSTRHRSSKSADLSSTHQNSLRLDTAIVHRRPVSISGPRTAPPAEIRPDCDPASVPPLPRSSALFPASPTNDPTFFHTLSMTATASTKLGATLFPIDYTNQSPRVPFPAAPARAPPPPPGIIDPIDKHMQLLVHELGFNENKVKRALAMCDTGSGIDLQHAIELLMVESKRESSVSNTPVELPTPTNILGSPLRLRRREKKDICDGGCKRMTSASINTSLANSRVGSIYSRHSNPRRTRSRSTGGNTPNENDVPISPITDIYGGHSDAEIDASDYDDDASEIRREQLDMVSPLMATPIMSSVRRMGTKKAWKVLGVSEQEPSINKKDSKLGGLARTRSKSQGVVGMEEYEKRIERRRSQRMLKQAREEQGGVLKQGLQENLKGLGFSGLGGLRVVERELVGQKGKSRVKREGCMPASPC